MADVDKVLVYSLALWNSAALTFFHLFAAGK